MSPVWGVFDPEQGDNGDNERGDTLNHVDESPTPKTEFTIQLPYPESQQPGETARSGGAEVEVTQPGVELGRSVPCSEDEGASDVDTSLEQSE